jgi:hypothetical protein
MNYQELHEEAPRQGQAALTAATPRPIAVFNQFNPQEHYTVSEGLCGFAWIRFPGNTAWGRWAKKAGIASSAYPTGLQIWVRDGGQSVERKEAYARAYAEVLNRAGITAWPESRLD